MAAGDSQRWQAALEVEWVAPYYGTIAIAQWRLQKLYNLLKSCMDSMTSPTFTSLCRVVGCNVSAFLHIAEFSVSTS